MIQESKSWYVAPGPPERTRGEKGSTNHSRPGSPAFEEKQSMVFPDKTRVYYQAQLLTVAENKNVRIALKCNLFKTDGERASFDEIGIQVLCPAHFTFVKAEEEEATFKFLIPFEAMQSTGSTTFWASVT